jgi:hypothetical protein
LLGLQNLKISIKVTETTVECPAKGCTQIVERQRESFRREEKFKCPVHLIYISPSTFEYNRETDNLLWKSKVDIALLEEIEEVKREHRFGRDNSEDALTWNVFRYLEKSGLLSKMLSDFTQENQQNSDLIYWSYSQKENQSWSLLNNARKEFGESIERSSEPDLIAITDKALFFIEAKFTASNNTTPSNPKVYKNYLNGGDNLFTQIFKSNFETIAIKEKKYELLRFWLLGSWIAKNLGLDFYLINIVLSEQEKDIEERFISLINIDNHRQFKRLSWEYIYKYISENVPNNQEKKSLMTYFQGKTIGYDRFGKLKKAFYI